MRQPRFYVYKIVVDGNGAPCIDDGLWTLAVCKPIIRKTARKGGWVFGFGTNAEDPPNRLVYIAEITDRLTDGEYFRLPRFRTRYDCIYREQNGRMKLRREAKFHIGPGALQHDLGEYPDYDRANVLVSTNFRYFGGRGTDEWKDDAMRLARLVESMGQGHRVNHGSMIREELDALRHRMWKQHRRKVVGRPMHESPGRECGTTGKCH